jgi:hypothetical protein
MGIFLSILGHLSFIGQLQDEMNDIKTEYETLQVTVRGKTKRTMT